MGECKECSTLRMQSTVHMAKYLHVERGMRGVVFSALVCSGCIHYSLLLGKEDEYVAP